MNIKNLETERDYVIEKSKDNVNLVIENSSYLSRLFSLLDYTSLNQTDSQKSILNNISKLNNFSSSFNTLKNVAGFCVYPNFVETVKNNLKDQNVKIVSVAGGFPTSQTYLSIKLEEIMLAIKKGADEIDIVMNTGDFLSENYENISKEISIIKHEIGSTHLKVILETGLLQDTNSIYLASQIAMQSGADFIKTSTGKIQPAASYEAMAVMAIAVKDYYIKTNKKIGIKPAGGIVETKDAIVYSEILLNVLGEDWFNANLFRIGASRLANNILFSYIKTIDKTADAIKYF